MDEKLTKDLMRMLDLNETVDQLARANSIHWYGNVLRKDRNNILRRALDLIVSWTSKRGRPKNTWLDTVVERVVNMD